jgi:large subunit ribosomal protein L10
MVDEIRGVLDQVNNLFLVSLAGLSSNEINQLRASLRRNGAQLRVVKNRLARRAAQGGPVAQLDRWFRGPTALVFHPRDAVGMAKQLVEFAKDHPRLTVRAGLLDRSQVVAGEQAQAVADLPTLEQARARLLALMMAPATRLVRLIAAPGAQLARAVDARVKKEGGADAPAGDGAE